MPKYFFHLATANFIVPDHTDGRDLGDVSAARACAIDTIKEIMQGKPWRGLNPATSTIEVTDARGRPFLKVAFTEALRSSAETRPQMSLAK